jgi:predicted hotdog family 3-hydroxylacyl-ACP dehydratase
MTVPAPATVLRHRGPALLLGDVTDFTGTTLRCTSRDDGPWRWARLLEGAAQTAGFLAGLQGTGVRNTAVIAEYRAIRVHAPRHVGPVTFVARLDRQVMRFWRCRVEVRSVDDELLLDGTVTVAPAST